MRRTTPTNKCTARRGDTTCHRPANHEGPHRAPWADENGTEFIRWWFTAQHGWASRLNIDSAVA